MNKRKKKHVIAVIQARMGSTRLKNKMLIKLHGIPIIKWVISRVLNTKKIEQVIVTIPKGDNDNELYSFLKSIDVRIHRGSEFDVLTRFHEAASLFNATHVVRICADNPLVSPEEIDNLIDFYFSENCDYAYNHVPINNLYPNGLGAEIVSLDILNSINKKAYQEDHREHIFNYIWDNEDKYSIKTFDPPNRKIRHPEIKLDLDTQEDLLFLESRPIAINMSSEKIVSLFADN